MINNLGFRTLSDCKISTKTLNKKPVRGFILQNKIQRKIESLGLHSKQEGKYINYLLTLPTDMLEEVYELLQNSKNIEPALKLIEANKTLYK